MAKPAYFSICSKNYMAYVLTLGRSLKRADPDADFTIFLADAPLSENEAADVEFKTVAAVDLDLPNFSDMVLRYSIMELNTAVKPACFRYLFEQCGDPAAVYLDPDILVLRPLEHVEAALKAGAELVLTPHSLTPLDDGGDPDDLRLLRTGAYNLGFAAIARSEATSRFLEWWNARLATDCRVALDDGMFVDQKWMDLAPSYLEKTTILRHPGYNVAYWNLCGRPVTRGPDGWLASGEPLFFFHFSGVVPGDGTVFSRHQNRFGADDIGELNTLLQDYLHRLAVNGHDGWRTAPYAFALPGDMKGIDGFARAAFRRRHPEPLSSTGFDLAAFEALCNAPAEMIGSDTGSMVTNLTYEIWAQRPDLRRIFDLSRRDERERFNAWLLTSGAEEHRIPERFLAHIGKPAGAPPVAEPSLKARAVMALVRRRAALRPVLWFLPPRWVDAARRRLNAAIAGPKGAEIVGGPVEPDTRRLPLAVYGYFSTESGLGQAARREFRALRSAGVPAVARLVTAPDFQNREVFEYPFDDSGRGADIHLIHVNADQTAVAESWAPPEMFCADSYRIGFWAWELERFPQQWAAAFDRVDEIWTPSRFVANGVAQMTGKPVRVFAHPVPVLGETDERARREARTAFALPQDGVIFLSLFDFNSYTERKNPMGVLDAFERARREAPDLRLVLKCHGGPRHDRERLRIFERVRDMEGVYIIDRVLDAPEMDRLFSACDGLISLHRSEGFGLTIAEAMARGKAVVATNYSGCTDFFDAEVGEPVDYALIDVPSGAYPHGEVAQWAEPDTAAAADALVRLSSDEVLRARLGAAARGRVSERLSLDRIGRTMAERLNEIRRGLKRRAG